MRRAEDLKPGDKVDLWTGVGFSHYTVTRVGLCRTRGGWGSPGPRCVWMTRRWGGKITNPIRFTVEALQVKLDQAAQHQARRAAYA